MTAYLPFILFFLSACALNYLKEIDRLERGEAPRRDGRKFLAIAIAALILTFLFTLISADAGLILLTLSLYLFVILAGITAGQRLAWEIYLRRNPDLFEEE